MFVLPLIFEAAFHIKFRRLHANLLPILMLVIPGVLLTTAILGLLVAAAIRMSLTTALVFDALLAATDLVSPTHSSFCRLGWMSTFRRSW